jgi:hypothetical protein
LQIAELSNLTQGMPDPSNIHATVIRSIRSGGAGSFTNKINKLGEFSAGVDTQSLYYNTLAFWDVANNIANKLSPEYNWELMQHQIIVYRYVERDHHNGNIIQPIPMSCSWSIDFANEWRAGRGCCIYEIVLNQNSLFLSLSYPNSMFHTLRTLDENRDRLELFGELHYLLNQDQLEITLPPCILYFEQYRVEDGVYIYTYTAKIIDREKILYAFKYFIQHGMIYDPAMDEDNIAL